MTRVDKKIDFLKTHEKKFDIKIYWFINYLPLKITKNKKKIKKLDLTKNKKVKKKSKKVKKSQKKSKKVSTLVNPKFQLVFKLKSIFLFFYIKMKN